jgi:hypothetical protein
MPMAVRTLQSQTTAAATSAYSLAAAMLVSASVNYAAGSGPASITLGDFDGNGRWDLAVANQGAGSVSVLLGNGNGTFKTAVNYSVGTAPSTIVTGDFNGDGRTDLASANFFSNNVSVLLSKPMAHFRLR